MSAGYIYNCVFISSLTWCWISWRKTSLRPLVLPSITTSPSFSPWHCWAWVSSLPASVCTTNQKLPSHWKVSPLALSLLELQLFYWGSSIPPPPPLPPLFIVNLSKLTKVINANVIKIYNQNYKYYDYCWSVVWVVELENDRLWLEVVVLWLREGIN